MFNTWSKVSNASSGTNIDWNVSNAQMRFPRVTVEPELSSSHIDVINEVNPGSRPHRGWIATRWRICFLSHLGRKISDSTGIIKILRWLSICMAVQVLQHVGMMNGPMLAQRWAPCWDVGTTSHRRLDPHGFVRYIHGELLLTGYLFWEPPPHPRGCKCHVCFLLWLVISIRVFRNAKHVCPAPTALTERPSSWRCCISFSWCKSVAREGANLHWWNGISIHWAIFLFWNTPRWLRAPKTLPRELWPVGQS